ncbi:hypothetical protein [Schleiferilactobacillus perolens]|uniref:hypothetical protein n=1 Tax=Schleiferilactobacillus perolens TaxID=100468 RepID=UPI002355C8CA|nr:hypothetical protein [Schleiferilactobacillus perolens]MCI2170036.1 hypothetical protein [Schleiferilactobacillus perolens]
MFETPLGFITINVNDQPASFKVVKRVPWQEDSVIIKDRYYLQLSPGQLTTDTRICIRFTPIVHGVFDPDTDDSEIWLAFLHDKWFVSVGIAMPFMWDDKEFCEEDYEELKNGGSQVTITLNAPDYVTQIERGIGVAWVPNTATDWPMYQKLAAYTDFAGEPDELDM